MSEFNPNEYFDRKREEVFGASSGAFSFSDKEAEVAVARERKIQVLDERAKLLEAQEQANANSWVSRGDLDPESARGTLRNLQARALSGAGRTVGWLASAPLEAGSISLESGLSQEQLDAYTRKRQDIEAQEELERLTKHSDRYNTLSHDQAQRMEVLRSRPTSLQEGDEELLAQRSKTYNKASQAQYQEGPGSDMAPTQYQEGPTRQREFQSVEERLDSARGMRRASEVIDDVTDWSSIVHQGRATELSEDIARNGEAGLKKLRGAVQQFEDDGVTAGAVTEGLSAVVDLSLAGLESLGDNPIAVAEYVAENAPQLALGAGSKVAMGAANLGYGLQNYRAGLKKYAEENDGAYPPAEEREWMLTNALGASLANQIGDMTMLGGALSKSARKATRVSAKRSLLGIGGATAKGTATEALTEGSQTYMEGQASRDPVTLEEGYEATVIGGGVGGSISGAGRTGAVLAGNTPEQQQASANRASEVSTFRQAVQSGDTTVYTDPNSKEYNPAKGVGVMLRRNQQADVTPEQKAENDRQASQIVDGLSEEVEGLRAEYENATPEGIAQTRTLLERAEQSGDEETAGFLREELGGLEAISEAEVKQRKARLDTAERQLNEATRLRDRMRNDEQPDTETSEAQINLADQAPETEGSSQAAESVINLAMTTTGSLSPERARELADNTGNAFTSEQREYLTRYSESQARENRLKSLEGVRSNIFEGGVGFVGVNQYRSRLRNHLETGNMQGAQTQLKGLRGFANQHAAKQKAAEAALEEVEGTDNKIHLMYSRSEGWQRTPGPITKRQREQNGGMTIQDTDKGRQFVRAIAEEAPVLESAAQELEAAYKLRFPEATPAETATGSTTASVPVMVTQGMRRQLGERGYTPEQIRRLRPQEANDILETPTESGGVTATSQQSNTETVKRYTPQSVRQGAEENKVYVFGDNLLGRGKKGQAVIRDEPNAIGIPTKRKPSMSGDAFFGQNVVEEKAAITTALDRVIEARNQGKTVVMPEDGIGTGLANLQQRSPEVYEHLQTELVRGGLVQQGNTEATQETANAQTAPAETAAAEPAAQDPAPEAESTQSAESAPAADESVDESTPEPTPAEAVVEADEATAEEAADGSASVATDEQTNQDYDTRTGEIIEEAMPQEAAPSPQIDGKLTLFKEKAGETLAKAKGPLKRGTFKSTNLIQAYFTQGSAKKNKLSRQPLVEVEQFATKLMSDPELANRYLAEPMDDHQAEFMVMVSGLIEDWNGAVAGNLPKADSGNPEYYHRDLSRFLQEDGSLDENARTAISAAAIQWVLEQGLAPTINDDSAINAILNRDADHRVTSKERALLGRIGARESVVMNNLGEKAAQALNLRADKDAPANHQAQLHGALGAHALALLANRKLIQSNMVTGKQLREAQDKDGPVVKGDATNEFISLARREGVVHPTSRGIIENGKGTKGVLANLLGMENGLKAPLREPGIYNQKSPRNTDRGIAKQQREILEKEAAKGYRIRRDVHRVFTQLPEDALEAIAGVVQEGSRRVHVANEKSVEGRNEALRRELARYREFAADQEAQLDGLDGLFYFTPSVWRQHRVGLEQNLVNPQSSKIHRHQMGMDGWETVVTRNGGDSETEFLLAVADGLGVKTDKQRNEASLVQVQDKMADPIIRAGVIAIMESSNNEGMTREQADAVTAAARAGGENFHSLDVLIGLAQYEQVGEGGSFTTQMFREVDGVTNGPMLAQFQLGAAQDANELLDTLHRGGFFEQGYGTEQYGDWRSQPGNLDLYESMARDLDESFRRSVAAEPEKSPLYDAVFTFTGPLSKDGGVSKDGRNLVKKPLTALVFGAGLKGTVDDMAYGLAETAYNKFEDLANDSTLSEATKAQELQRLLEALNTLVRAGNPKLSVNTRMSLDEAMSYELKVAEVRAVERAFRDSLGQDIEMTLEGRFKTFIETRSTLNLAANVSYELYQVAYDYLRNDLVEKLMDAGELDYRQTKDGKRVPLQDLSASQEQAIRTRLKKLEPVIHTPFSKASKDLDSGINLAKGRRQLSDELAYTSEVKFGWGVYRGPNRRKQQGLKPHGFKRVESSPGVRAVIMAIHASDSAISAYSYRNRPALNVHDAHGLGLNQVQEGAQDLNRNTFNVLAGYSVPSEITDALERTVTGFREVMGEIGSNSELAEAYRQAEKAVYRKLDDQQKEALATSRLDAFGLALAQSKDAARRADSLKFEVLGQLESLDQYAMQGGNYMVSDSDLAKVAKLGEARARKPSLASLEAAAEIAARFDPKKAQQTHTRPEVQEAPEQPSVASRDSAWGTVGTPAIESDPALVEALENGTVKDAASALRFLAPHVKSMSAGRTREFYRELIQALGQSLDGNVPIRYITPDTSAQGADPSKLTNTRGWYHYDGPKGEEGVFIKSPDFTDSGVTPELMLHELIHAAVARRVAAEKGKQGTPLAEVLVELERLRVKAQARVNADPALAEQFSQAVSSVDELIAWGMTNPRFQRRVLNEVRIESKTRKNPLVSGMKRLIDSLVGILFRGSSQSRQDMRYNGMANLIANVSALFGEVAQNREARGEQEILLRQEGPASGLLTTEQVFDALANADRPLDPATQEHLRGLLTGLVEHLHGPFGVYKDEAERTAATAPEEVFTKSLASGEFPFASRSLAVGFPMSDQQAFVLEQVEATVKASLDSYDVAYQELNRLWKQASRQVTPETLSDDPRQAKAMHEFLFKTVENAGDGRSAHLSRFAALAMVHPPLMEALQVRSTAPETQGPQTLGQRLMDWFKRALNVLHGRLTRTREDQQLDQRLATLVGQLVDIEAKHRKTLDQRELSAMDRLEDGIKGTTDQVREKIEGLAGSQTLRDHASGYVRGIAAMTRTVAGDRADELMEHLNRLRDQHFRKRQGVLASVIREMRVAYDEGSMDAHTLLREVAKYNEHERVHIVDTTKQNVLSSFANEGKDLDSVTREALTKVLLHTDAAALVDQIGQDQLVRLVEDPVALEAAIKEAEAGLSRSSAEVGRYYVAAAKDSGYHMATGYTVSDNLMLNAHNIASLAGTDKHGSLSESQIQEAEATLDPLVSLYALRYTSETDKGRVRDALRTELNRGTESGVMMVLQLHKQLRKEAQERLFDGSPVHLQKGYTAEIFNPHKSVSVAGAKEGRELQRLGWAKGFQVPQDPANPGEVQHFYHVRDGGLQHHVTGVFSYSGNTARGSTLHSGLSRAGADGVHTKNERETRRVAARKKPAIDAMFHKDASYDPSQVTGSRMAPVLNRAGQVVNYRHTMSEANKDALLERNNRLEDVLGATAAANFDKVASQEQNKLAVEALHKQYLEEYAEKPNSYVTVSATSEDPQLRETWRLLPDETKQAVIDTWGSPEMLIRADLVDINFGYRKYSLGDMFAKDAEERNAMEKIFVGILESLLDKKAALRVRQAEDVWQALVREIKDNIVVKNLVTLLGNIASNLSLLLWSGVPVTDIVRNHRVAIENVVAYRRDNTELTRLKQMRDIGYAGTDPQRDQRIAELEDALARNKAKDLVDAGMLPTIVEDVDIHDDPFSYKTMAAEKTDKWVAKVPSPLRAAGRTLYMAHDTPLYKALSQATQLSDFVARYTVYQHLTTRRRNPLSREDALQRASDMFVNYDVPTHKGLQYLNDMGLVWFTKYYLRIQKTIMHLYRDNPGRAMMMITLENLLPGLPTLLDSQFTEKLGNPLSIGALKYPGTLDELITIKAALSPFN